MGNDKEIIIKQKLLERVAEIELTNVLALSKDKVLNMDADTIHFYARQIAKDDYFIYLNDSPIVKKGQIIKVSPKGKIFVSEGGYKKFRNQSKLKMLFSQFNNLASLVSILVAIFLGISTYLKTNENSKLKEENMNLHLLIKSDSLLITKSKLIGFWTDDLKKRDTITLLRFMENNEWFQLEKSESNVDTIYKGEYRIGKRNGVFVRVYGAQHFQKDKSFKDYQSGILNYYFYLKNDSVIIDNQEDYTNYFYKCKL